MKYVKIQFDDESSYCVKPEEVGEYISAEIESLTSELFETITLSIVEMPEEEYEKLPEFEG